MVLSGLNLIIQARGDKAQYIGSVKRDGEMPRLKFIRIEDVDYDFPSRSCSSIRVI